MGSIGAGTRPVSVHGVPGPRNVGAGYQDHETVSAEYQDHEISVPFSPKSLH